METFDASVEERTINIAPQSPATRYWGFFIVGMVSQGMNVAEAWS